MRILHVHSGNLYGGVETLLINLVSTANCTQVEHQFAICFEGRVASELRKQGATVRQPHSQARLIEPVGGNLLSDRGAPRSAQAKAVRPGRHLYPYGD